MAFPSTGTHRPANLVLRDRRWCNATTFSSAWWPRRSICGAEHARNDHRVGLHQHVLHGRACCRHSDPRDRYDHSEVDVAATSVALRARATTAALRARATTAAFAQNAYPGGIVRTTHASDGSRACDHLHRVRRGGDASFYVTQTGTKPSSPQNDAYFEHPFWLRPPTAPPAPFSIPPGTRYQADIWVRKNARPLPTVEVWNIYNATGEAHAFHIHQLTFTALSSAFEPVDDQRVLLDTIAIPPATIVETFPKTNPLLAPSLTRIKIDFTNVDTGTFVFHCHMLSHEDQGMMGIIHVY